jgi:predicted O-methyltransferase YrrM
LPTIPALADPGCTAFAEAYVPEDPVLDGARLRAAPAGIRCVSPGAGATLRFLAALLDARSAVEIGTGTGVSGTWLLRGMRPDGVLTSVDAEADHHRLARETFTAAGIPANRARLIAGYAPDVLPRLTDGAYDLVFASGDPREYAGHLHEATRLLRPGGVVVFDDAFAGGLLPDQAQRDAVTSAMRDLARALSEHEGFTELLLPVGDGLLCAVRRPHR